MAGGPIEIVNPVAAEEIAPWTRALATTFLRDPSGSTADRQIAILQRNWVPDRAWGARDDGRWVATLRTHERHLTVPGCDGTTRELVVDALTNVTVAATHRRRGLLAKMLGASLAAARERGDALSILIASEWPIYGRFGYAPATFASDLVLHSVRGGAVAPTEPGRVRQVHPDEFGQIGPTVFSQARRRRAGELDRDADWWNRMHGLDGYPPSDAPAHNLLVHEGDDGPDGLLSWTAGGDFSLAHPYTSATVDEFTAATDAAYRNLWSYASSIDLVDRVTVANRPVDEPLRWLLHDARALEARELVDFTWVRILDVEAALSARRFAVAGELVLEVADEALHPYASGRYLLAAEGDEVSCGRTDRPVDLELTQRALASICLGGVSLRALAIAGTVHERRPGALTRADAMFMTPLAPWTATWF